MAKMMKRSCLVIYMFCKVNYVYVTSILQYETPDLDDQFHNFQITKPTPVSGTATDGDPQSAITLTNRLYITFNFKGRGNAFLFCQEVDGVKDIHSFTVEIGGNSSNDRVAIYNSTSARFMEPIAKRRMVGITSENEYRSYWLLWDLDTRRVSVGLCNDPNEQEILRSPPFLNYNINHISISTNNDNSGSWEFGSDKHLYGACGNNASACLHFTNCSNINNSSTRATCMPIIPQEDEPMFGNGNCLYVCGQGLCPYQGDCNDNKVCESGYDYGWSLATLEYSRSGSAVQRDLTIDLTLSSIIEESTAARLTTSKLLLFSQVPTVLSSVTASPLLDISSATTVTTSTLAMASFGNNILSVTTATPVPSISSVAASSLSSQRTTTLMGIATYSISTNKLSNTIKWIATAILQSKTETSLSKVTETSVSISTTIYNPQSDSATSVSGNPSEVNLTTGFANAAFTKNSNKLSVQYNLIAGADKVATIAATVSVAVLCLGGLIVYVACTRCTLYTVFPAAASTDETNEEEESEVTGSPP